MLPNNQKPLKKRILKEGDWESYSNTTSDSLEQDYGRHTPPTRGQVRLNHSYLPEAATVSQVLPAEESIFNFSAGNYDRSQFQDTTGRHQQSTSEESEEYCIDQIDSVAQPVASSPRVIIELGRKKNLASFSRTPGNLAQPMASRFPLDANNILRGSSGLVYTSFHKVIPLRHFNVIANPQFPDCPYPLRPPPFSSMDSLNYEIEHSFEQITFKEINITDVLKYSGISQCELDLELALSYPLLYGFSYAKKSGGKSSTVRAVTKPLYRQSSSGVSGESLLQDTNKMPNLRKNCQIPEKDQNYLEKRRRNNLAAKKFRFARKRKYYSLAVIKEILHQKILTLFQKLLQLYHDREVIAQKLDMAYGSFINFRNKCDGNNKELFEHIFQLYLPQQ